MGGATSASETYHPVVQRSLSGGDLEGASQEISTLSNQNPPIPVQPRLFLYLLNSKLRRPKFNNNPTSK